jgi:thiol-disulfide isomerase/thioredoxin
MMIERLLLLGGVVLAVAVVWLVVRLWRTRRLAALRDTSPLATIVPVGRPAVVAFSTPTCAECRTRQAPALARLRAEFGDTISVQTLAATEHPELVDQLGVLTVPATAVVDARGVVRQLNLGFADTARLAAQVRALAPLAAS